MGITIIDKNGIQQDWAWLQANYGPVTIDEPSGVTDYYRVIQFTEIEGPMAAQCTVLDAQGMPVVGQRVIYSWPGGPSQPGSGWDEQGAVEITNGLGVAEHTMGSGEAYFPPNKGPISWWVYGEGVSQRVSGLGWVGNTNHRHVQVIMRMSGSENGGGDGDYTVLADAIKYAGDQIYNGFVALANATASAVPPDDKWAELDQRLAAIQQLLTEISQG